MRTVDMKIEYIPVKNLSVVWVQSQRPYNSKWAKEIADDLDPDKFDPLIVTKPNGQGIYHIIEGQHRRHALEMYAARHNSTGRGGDEMAPCRIVADADPARAAEIWLGINGGRKAVKPIHGFTVAVIAGREPEVTIQQLLTNNSFSVTSEKKKNGIAAVGALRTVFDRHGKTTLNNVLRTLQWLWHGDPTAVSTVMLRGLGLFLHEFGSHIDNKRLVNKIADKWSPYKLSEAAKARKQSSLERIDEAIAELILREYNKGLKEGSKLKRKS
jgi:Family of unknown function (DUF6551)